MLAGLDLVLGPGEVALVEGANGAGKTTLLRIAAGLIAADRGSVLVRAPPEREGGDYRRQWGCSRPAIGVSTLG